MANVGSAAAGKTLIGAGNGASPTYASIGTNSGLTAHGVVVAEGAGAFAATAAGTAGQILQSGGAAADPLYSTAIYPSTAGTSGNVLTSDGTNFVSGSLPSKASNAQVYLNSTISNATGDGTFVTPVIFDTKSFDLGSNYDPTTGLFTIPTTGKYLVCVGITFTGLLVAHTSAEVRILANGVTVTRNQFNPFVSSVSGQFTYCQSLVISGTAGQNINIVSAVSGGTKVVGFLGASFGEYCTASFTFLG